MAMHDNTTDDRPWTREEYNRFVAEGVREAEAEREAVAVEILNILDTPLVLSRAWEAAGEEGQVVS